MVISYSLLPGVNDRIFQGQTNIDRMCSQTDPVPCSNVNGGIEFFVVGGQSGGDTLSSASSGNYGIDFDPASALQSYSYYLVN